MSSALATVETAAPVAIEIAALSGGPQQMIQKARAIAGPLKEVIKSAGLVRNIQGKEYVEVEGWTTMLAMLGVFPQVEWSRRIGDGLPFSYESRVLLVHMATGRVVGAAESMASAAEGAPWGKREFSCRSMSETRATGKAARLSFSWIMKMTGYNPTPAEDMPDERDASPRKVPPAQPRTAGGAKAAPTERKAAPVAVASEAEVVVETEAAPEPPAHDEERDMGRRRLWAVLQKLGASDPEKFGALIKDTDVGRAYRLSFLANYAGKPLASMNELTASEMRTIANEIEREYELPTAAQQGAA